MRGGRNKFGPIYKLDRALKQQRKAEVLVSPLCQTDCNKPLRSGTRSPRASSDTWAEEHIVEFTVEDSRWPLPPRVPPLVEELVRCDPDEALVKNKIRQRLQQHKCQWIKDGMPGFFSLMYLLTEQTLLCAVEWARTAVFFSQLQSVQTQVREALLEYARISQSSGRFTQLLQCLSEIHFMSTLAEDYLWSKHESGEVLCNNLIAEMLHAKRSNT
uniref:Uncharacterized protein n=1 Tax=Knipowitschia caucasica TaxID=637954 RepID=A0AAV2IWZ8_KNICA